MSALVWNDVGQRYYENGVSRGVFYGTDGVGIAWNGLTSVQEQSVDSAEPLYFDGVKYGDLVTLGDFEGKMTAFTYPDEFLEYEGQGQAEVGVFLTAQTKLRFGLSWRTEIHNDLGESIGHKLHVLYNVLAIAATKTFETMSLDSEPMDFEWDISAVPEPVDNFRPTAYMVIDSRKIDPLLLLDLENLLYGTEETDPELPNMNGLISFVMNWGRFVVTDNGDGTWTATSPIEGVIEMLDAESFAIDIETAIYLDPDSYEISSTENEEIP